MLHIVNITSAIDAIMVFLDERLDIVVDVSLFHSVLCEIVDHDKYNI